MTYGLMIITDLTGLSEAESRLFRKKRKQLMKRTSLKKVKNGVYFIPCEKFVLSKNEVVDFEQIEGLIREFQVRASYFMVTQIEPEYLVEGDPFEDGRLDVSRMKNYFVLKPIKILEE